MVTSLPSLRWLLWNAMLKLHTHGLCIKTSSLLATYGVKQLSISLKALVIWQPRPHRNEGRFVNGVVSAMPERHRTREISSRPLTTACTRSSCNWECCVHCLRTVHLNMQHWESVPSCLKCCQNAFIENNRISYGQHPRQIKTSSTANTTGGYKARRIQNSGTDTTLFTHTKV